MPFRSACWNITGIESQRYVCMKGEIAFIQPECYISGDTASAIWRIAMGEAERTYHK